MTLFNILLGISLLLVGAVVFLSGIVGMALIGRWVYRKCEPMINRVGWALVR